MRVTHIIKHNKGSETPQRALFLKLHIYLLKRVGKESEFQFDVGVMIHAVKSDKANRWRTRQYTFRDKFGFWRLLHTLVKPKSRTYILIEDGEKTLALLDVFTLGFQKGWKWNQTVIKCPPTIVRGRKENASIAFVETRNVWPEQLTDTYCGARTCKKSLSGDGSECINGGPKAAHDALTMQSFWLEWWDFLKRYDLGGFATTIGSQAVRVFRHVYMKHKILIDNNRPALRLARDCFKGGRNECWFVGSARGDFYLLDVNSMYASIMASLAVPIRLRGYTDHALPEDLRRWARNRTVFADVLVRTDQPLFGIRDNHKLVFPVGQFRAQLCSSEILYALARAEIRHVYRAAIYEHAPAFQAFVNDFWQRRRAAITHGDIKLADKYKLLLAAFYGKWSQSGRTWETVEHTDSKKIKRWTQLDYATDEVTEYRQFGGMIQRLCKEAESFESMPAISAAIAANARMMLWSLMSAAGLENVYYVDTDSLLVNHQGFTLLRAYIRPHELGGLRLVGQYEDIAIFAGKDYRFGSRVRHKGISADAPVVSDSIYEQTTTRTLEHMMRDGDLARARERKVQKSLVRVYDKGVVGPDGRVTPIRKDEHGNSGTD